MCIELAIFVWCVIQPDIHFRWNVQDDIDQPFATTTSQSKPGRKKHITYSKRPIGSGDINGDDTDQFNLIYRSIISTSDHSDDNDNDDEEEECDDDKKNIKVNNNSIQYDKMNDIITITITITVTVTITITVTKTITLMRTVTITMKFVIQ